LSTPLNGFTLRHATSEEIMSSWKAWLSAAFRIVNTRLALACRRRSLSLSSLSGIVGPYPAWFAIRGAVFTRPRCHLRTFSGQLTALFVAKCRIDVGLGAPTGVDNVPSFGLLGFEVGFDGFRHCMRFA
jgi:hypothetical protein